MATGTNMGTMEPKQSPMPTAQKAPSNVLSPAPTKAPVVSQPAPRKAPVRRPPVTLPQAQSRTGRRAPVVLPQARSRTAPTGIAAQAQAQTELADSRKEQMADLNAANARITQAPLPPKDLAREGQRIEGGRLSDLAGETETINALEQLGVPTTTQPAIATDPFNQDILQSKLQPLGASNAILTPAQIEEQRRAQQEAILRRIQ